MMEKTERTTARCEDCGKDYRIPDPQRTYTCKACGGTVRAVANEETEKHHLEGAITCSSCHAVNHHGAHFCVECGAILGASPTLERDEEEVVARREATSELKRGYAWMAAVTWLYRLGAGAYLLVTAVAVMALSSTDVPLGPGILVAALSTVLTVAMLMGALQILFRPFVWTVSIACLASVVALAHLVGPNPLGLMLFWTIAWAALFWAAVVPTRRFQRLIGEHTDLYITHHASRKTKRSLEGRSAGQKHERLMRAMEGAFRRARRVSIGLGGAICLASALGTYAVYAYVRPQVLSTVLEDFRAAWSDSAFPAIAGFFPSQIGDREALRLEGMAEGYGWNGSLPPLGEGRTREEGEQVWVDYDVADLPMSACWVLDARKWRLVELDLPAPPLQPVIERFLAAWRRSDPKAMAAFYPTDYQEDMLASISRAVGRRGWDSFPEVEETRTSEPDEDGEVVVTLTLEDGEVTTKWILRGDGRWGLHGLKFPKP